ncbi:MAG: efflux RND transporter periplasmic adaptor subunit [Candidatus Riflebacteria bacterium]|nr:efflux RND transporter periplasmic adaptor subunit [Candidatus Riflebacteria bacterium]
MNPRIASLITVFVALTSMATAQINVNAVKPKTGNIHQRLLFTGETRPLIESYAASDVTGPVAQIMIEEGQKVTQGQALGKIDDIRFAIALRQAEAALDRTKQQLIEDEKDLERNKTLFDRKAITQKALDMATTVYIKSKSAQKQAQADYDKAKLDLDRCIIRAPIAGYFIDRSIEIGQAMARGQNMGKVIDLDHVYVDARIPESEIRKIKIGQESLVEDKFAGIVSFINLYADSSRSFKVRVKVANPDLYFKGNMFVKGLITLATYEEAPLFPSQAIRNFRGESFVFTIKDGKSYRRKINIIAQEGNFTYAKEISTDDEVVTVGQDTLADGMEVVVRPANGSVATDTANPSEHSGIRGSNGQRP